MSIAELDSARVQAVEQRMIGIMNDASLALMASIGHRTGLFDTMGRLEWTTSAELAQAAGLSERYVREWLGAMVTGGIVEHDPALATYRLPPEHAARLTRDAAPANLASLMQWVSVLGSAEDHVVEAFRHGRGVPYSAYHRFHEVMAEESMQTTVIPLHDAILPLVDGLRARLEQGIDVLDIGCGSGHTLNAMAKRYPASRFLGRDLSEEAVAHARADARRAGLTNLRFEAADVATMTDSEAFDLITAFDAIHDQAHPARVLHNIARALRPRGVFLMQDIAGSSHLHENIGRPLAPLVYTISCMHCMSVSLAGNGVGLGAAWGKEKALEMLADAGFTDVRVEQLDHDIMNYYYVARLVR